MDGGSFGGRGVGDFRVPVFFGMLGVTLFGLLFTPVFYVVVRWIGEKVGQREGLSALQFH